MKEEMMTPLLGKGWVAEETIFGEKLLSYTKRRVPKRENTETFGKCLSCENTLLLGDSCIVLKNPKGHLRAVFCSAPCQRRYYFDKIVRKRGQRLQKPGNKQVPLSSKILTI